MAKSYVTKFTEYVAEQRDALEAKLKSKGLAPSPNSTFGSLVSQLDGLQKEYKPVSYERDSMLPNFDEMFDNDPLRAINGGEYLGCAYFLMYVTKENLVGFYFSNPTTDSAAGYTADKLILSDGQEFDSPNSTSWTATVGESGIYTDTEGNRYCLLKLYRHNPMTQTGTSARYVIYGVRECIDDMVLGMYYWTFQSGSTTYTNKVNKAGMKYYRYVGSNVTVENVTSVKWLLPFEQSAGTAAGTNPSMSLEVCRVDGNHGFTGIGNYGYYLKKIIFNGEYFNATSSSTGTIDIGTETSSYIVEEPLYIDYLQLPYGENSNFKFYILARIKNLYISDSISYLQFVYINDTTYKDHDNSCPPIETLHIGNGLTTGFMSTTITNSKNYPLFYNLKNVTVSPNAFNINDTGITIDFKYAYNLTRESVLNMFNNFADRTGKGVNYLSLPSNVKEMMTEDEIAILTNKNWTLS